MPRDSWPTRFWVWKHYPLNFRHDMNCQDATAKVPVMNGRNLQFPSEFRVHAANRLAQGQVFGVIIHDANANQVRSGVGHQFYVPTADDLAIVQEIFPGTDSGNPSWTQVEAALILGGMDMAKLRNCNGATLIRLLHRAKQKDASANVNATQEGRDAELPRLPRSTHQSQKRSTERGEGRAKLIAALTKHHQYADDSCLNQEPVGNNALAKAAGVSVSTASAFFDDKFQGHTKYKTICRDSGNLVAALKLLNDEFTPYHLLGEASSDLAAPEEENADDE